LYCSAIEAKGLSKYLKGEIKPKLIIETQQSQDGVIPHLQKHISYFATVNNGNASWV